MNCKIQGSLQKSENPKWPPTLGSLVLVDHPNYINNLSVGTVRQYLPNVGSANGSTGLTGAMITLLNNKHHNEIELEQQNIVPTGLSTGTLLLLPNVHGWKYVDIKKFNKTFGHCFGKLLDKSIHEDQGVSKNNDAFNDDVFNDDVFNDDTFNDTSLLNNKGELVTDKLFTPPTTKVKDLLLSKIELNETISREESKIIVVHDTIDTKDDEINEGKKIVEWIKDNMLYDNEFKIFDGLKMGIFNGYVHFSRRGIRVDDVINENDLPDLQYFKWQYGIPIDYDTLKHILFQNNFQKKIKIDTDEQKEAKRIFSQEYLIALQPEPQYQMWTLKRLIMCWFADEELQTYVRKIKVIINQYKSRVDVLPSIVVYPRYGITSVKKVLTKILHYFMPYQNIGWSCSQPSHFIKVNDLVYYTNDNIDLKLYFTKIIGLKDDALKVKRKLK